MQKDPDSNLWFGMHAATSIFTALRAGSLYAVLSETENVQVSLRGNGNSPVTDLIRRYLS